jgi:hypothetical protein
MRLRKLLPLFVIALLCLFVFSDLASACDRPGLFGRLRDRRAAGPGCCGGCRPVTPMAGGYYPVPARPPVVRPATPVFVPQVMPGPGNCPNGRCPVRP